MYLYFTNQFAGGATQSKLHKTHEQSSAMISNSSEPLPGLAEIFGANYNNMFDLTWSCTPLGAVAFTISKQAIYTDLENFILAQKF